MPSPLVRILQDTASVELTYSQIDLRLLAEDDFVFTPELLGESYHQQLIALCEQAGFVPHIVQQASQLSTLIALVSCGFGVALVPASTQGYPLNNSVRFVNIEPISPLSEVELYLLCTASTPHHPHSLPLTHFLNLLSGVHLAARSPLTDHPP